ncbi:hypothetical protein T439DRAFT_324110 [Meredithblackwellia eburnea MCA 4105]
MSEGSTSRNLVTSLSGSRGIYNILLSTVLGSSLWNSFVAGPISYKTLPRPLFSDLQGKLFPVYFTLQSIGSVTLLGLFVTSNRTALVRPVGFKLNAWLLGFMTAGSLANLLVVGPLVGKLIEQRKALVGNDETCPGQPGESVESREVTKKFGIAHGVSSLLNLGVVVAGIVHTAWVGQFGSLAL